MISVWHLYRMWRLHVLFFLLWWGGVANESLLLPWVPWPPKCYYINNLKWIVLFSCIFFVGANVCVCVCISPKNVLEYYTTWDCCKWNYFIHVLQFIRILTCLCIMIQPINLVMILWFLREKMYISRCQKINCKD